MRTSKLSILFALLILLGITVQTAHAMGAESLDSLDSTPRQEESPVQPVAPMPTSTRVSNGLARYQGWHFGALMGLGGAWVKVSASAPVSEYGSNARVSSSAKTDATLHFRVGALATRGFQFGSAFLLENVFGLLFTRMGGEMLGQSVALYRFDIPIQMNFAVGMGSVALVAGLGLECCIGLSSTPSDQYGPGGVSRFDAQLTPQIGLRYKAVQLSYFYAHGLWNQSLLGDYSYGRTSIKTEIHHAAQGAAVTVIF